jgi:hypothetical protein
MSTGSSSNQRRRAPARSSCARRLARLAAAAGLTGLGCGPGLRPREQAPAPVPVGEANLSEHTALAQDAALLSLVVRAARALSRERRVVADPRPLRPTGEFEWITAASFAAVPQAVLEARAAALRRAGVELGDALALGQNEACPGVFVLAKDASDKPHAGCPKEHVYVLAVGLPRAGTARLLAGQVYELTAGAAEGYWAVRVIATLLTRGGSSLTGYDYVVKKEPAGWRLIKTVALYTRE